MPVSSRTLNRIAAGLLFLGIFFFYLQPIEDPDFWWHLAAGRFIAASHQIPLSDPFSWTCQGSPWINNYWLYQIALYGIYLAGGTGGIILYKALIGILILWPVYLRLRQRGIETVWCSVAVGAAFWASRLSHVGWGERASLITLLAVSWMLWQLESVRAARLPRSSLWLWPPLMMLWANAHPGFCLGLIIAGCYALEALFDFKEPRRLWIVWGLLCGLATLATPYGFHTFSMLLEGLRYGGWIKEWQRTPLSPMVLYWILLAVFWTAAFYQRYKQGRFPLPLSFLAMALFLSQGSVRHVLYVPFFVLFAVPWIAAWIPYPKHAAKGLAVSLSLGLFIFTGWSASRIQGGIKRHFPTQACQFIDQNKIAGRLFNSYNFGGYCIWSLRERLPVFIDGRYPTVRGYVPLNDAMRKAQASPDLWEQFTRRWKIQTALMDRPALPEGFAIYDYYFPAKDWALVFQDETSRVFLRRGKDQLSMIRRFEIKRSALP